MIFIVGGKGLIGSAIVEFMQNSHLDYKIIQKENKDSFMGKKCETLIFANGNAWRYKANADPLFDFKASVASFVEYVHGIQYENFIHLSSVEVYDNKSSKEDTKENIIINPQKLNPYGYHKYLIEEYLKKFCDNYLIFRISSIVGKGLKKNPVYDAIHKDKKIMLSPNSTHNFINTKFIAKSIFNILNLGIRNEIFNLASKNSIRIDNLSNIIGYESEYTDDAEKYVENYDINTEKIQKYIELGTSEEAIIDYTKTLSV